MKYTNTVTHTNKFNLHLHLVLTHCVHICICQILYVLYIYISCHEYLYFIYFLDVLLLLYFLLIDFLINITEVEFVLVKTSVFSSAFQTRRKNWNHPSWFPVFLHVHPRLSLHGRGRHVWGQVLSHGRPSPPLLSPPVPACGPATDVERVTFSLS